MEEIKINQTSKLVFPGKIILNNEMKFSSENCIPFYSAKKSQEFFNETQKKLLSDIQTNIFSNLYQAKVMIEGQEFATTEHYFQMFKYSQGDKNFMETLSPNDVAMYGQRRLKMKKNYIQTINDLKQKKKEYPKNGENDYQINDIANPKLLIEDWNVKKIEVMLKGLRAKFTQNDELQKGLLKTNECWIIEHVERDKCWGDGGEKGIGTNYLGKLLMQVRYEINNKVEYTVDMEFLQTPMNKLIVY